MLCGNKREQLSVAELLEELCTPGVPCDLPAVIARGDEITKGAPFPFLVPADQELVERLLWPLRNAKCMYVLGQYLGTIALCGMVAEMSALLLFDISEVSFGGQPLLQVTERMVFGRSFERLGQKKRVEVLKASGLIDSEVEDSFKLIRETRNRCLHLYSTQHEKLDHDAKALYHAAARILVYVLGQDLREGALMLRPALRKHLEARGVVRVPTEAESVLGPSSRPQRN
jgi:hypothetical protein